MGMVNHHGEGPIDCNTLPFCAIPLNYQFVSLQYHDKKNNFLPLSYPSEDL